MLVRILLAPYWMAKEDDEKIKRQQKELDSLRLSELKTATLDVRGPELYQDHFTAKRWRMIVHNQGADTARNVLMRLRSIDPKPRYGRWFADYPYAVRRTSASAHDQLSGCKINPNDEDIYEVVSGWQIAEGDFFTEGLDTKGDRNFIRIEPDEHWELKYEVMAENAAPDKLFFDYVRERRCRLC